MTRAAPSSPRRWSERASAASACWRSPCATSTAPASWPTTSGAAYRHHRLRAVARPSPGRLHRRPARPVREPRPARRASASGDRRRAPTPACVYEGDFSYERGYAATLQMIAEAEPPEAIIGANDETAVGALAALRQARIEVPGRISVAGMTDTRLARFSDMTTVSVPMYQFGAAAARRIVAARTLPTRPCCPTGWCPARPRRGAASAPRPACG